MSQGVPNNPNGQATMANSEPVVIASDQSAVPVSAASLPLPSGAATSANQQTNALTDTQLRATPVPVSGTVTATATDLDIRNLSQAQDAVLIYGSDDGGTTKRVIKTDIGGAIQVDLEVASVTVTSSALPTGASTLAEQQTQTTALQLIDDTVYTDGAGTVTKGIAILGQDGTNPQAIKTDAAGELQVDVLTIPAITGTVTANAGTNLNTSALNLEATQLLVKAKTDNIPAQGQALAAASLPVVLTAAQITTLTPQTNALTDAQLRATAVPVSGTVTANAGTNLNTSALALSATQTDGTQKAIARGGAKGSTTAADITSTSQSADRNAMDVQIRTSAGAVVDAFSGGTEYTEDAVAAADPIGGVTILVRKDAPAAITSLDGDNVAQRGTNYGAAYSQIVTSGGAFVDTFGGGQQYADAAARGTATGTLAMGDDGTNIQAVKVDAAGELQIDVLTIAAGDNNIGNVDIVTMPAITGTVTANAGTNLNTSALNLEATQADIRTAVQLIDDTVKTLGTDTYLEATTKGLAIGAVRRDADTSAVNTDNEVAPLLVNAIGALKVEVFSGETLPVSAASLPLPAGASTSALQTQPGVDIGDVTINNAAGASAVNIQDGGNSITVDGTVAFSNTTIAVTNAGTFATQATLSDIVASGNITTQNLVPAGAATAGSAVLSGTLNGQGVIGVQITGTYTGALSLQGTVDNTNWITIGGLVFSDVATGIQSATIGSGVVGIFQADCGGFIQVRVTGLAAMTGTAVVSIRASVNSGVVALDTPLPAGTNNIGDVDVLTVNGVAPAFGTGARGATVQRVTIATDDSVPVTGTFWQATQPVSGTVAVTGVSTLAEQQTQTTALQLIDDTVKTLGTDTYLEGTTKGLAIGAIRRDANTTAASLDNEIAPLQVNSTGDLKVAQILPLPAGTNNIGDVDIVSGTITTVTTLTGTTTLTPGTAAANLGKAEDAIHGTGDTGVFILGVANEAQTTLAADGDYIAISTDIKGNNLVVGNIAHDGVDAGNPVKIGGVAVSGSASPTAVASGDRTRFIANRHGIPYQLGGHPNLIVREFDFGTAAQTDLQLSAALVSATERCYVVGFEAMCDNANSVAVSVRAGFGAASVPIASATGVSGMVASHPGVAAGSGLVLGNGSAVIAIGAAGEEPRLTSSAATSGNLHVVIRYFIIDET